MKAAWGTIALLSATVAAADESSAEPLPVVIVIAPEAAVVAPPHAVRQAIAADLGRPVVASTPPPQEVRARGVLTVSIDPAGHLLLVYCDGSGNEIRRTIAVSRDHEAVALIALLAGNLIRNEAEELLAQLAPPLAPPSPPSLPAARPLPSAPSPLMLTAVARPRDQRSRAEVHPWSLGVLGYVSSRSADPVYSPGSGLFLSRAVGRHFALGATDLLIAPVAGRTTLSGGPFVEAFWFAREWLQLFGQLGAPLQGSWGGHRDSAFGAQPFLGGGLRVWVSARASIAAGARVGIVATSNYSAAPTELVQGAVSVSGGMELGVHL